MNHSVDRIVSFSFVLILHFSHLTMTCVPIPLHLFFNISSSFIRCHHITLFQLATPPLCLFSHPPHLISPLHLVTMQIYLSPLTRKTGSSEAAKSASPVPADSGPVATPSPPRVNRGSKLGMKKSTPSFTLNLQKTTTSQGTQQDISSYKSPTKSPSQYFQICY